MRSPLILGSQLYIVNKVRYEGFQLVRVELLPVCEGVAEKLLCSAELSEVCPLLARHQLNLFAKDLPVLLLH